MVNGADNNSGTNIFKSLSNIISGIFGGHTRTEEKARLEAFLKAVPAEYCGWMKDGSLAYSPGFTKLLGINDIESLADIEAALSPSDAAALEGMFIRLQDEGKEFFLNVETADHNKTLRLSGSRGTDSTQHLAYDILWLSDITDVQQLTNKAKKALEDEQIQRERLQSALDVLPMPAWLRDQSTKIIWCNKAYADFVDSSAAGVIAEQKELPLRPPKKAEVTNAATSQSYGADLARDALTKREKQVSVGQITFGGKRKLVMIKESLMHGGSYTLGTLEDITREEELYEEQSRNVSAHKELLEQLATAVGIFNVDQKIEFFNSAFTQLWQLEDTYLNKKPKLGDIMERLREMRKLPEQSDFRSFKQSWMDMFTSLIDPYEEMIYQPDGSALRMLVVPHSMGGLMMIFEDVTSRLELESSYNTLIAVQKETLDNLTEAVVVYGGDGKVKLWNPAFANLWSLNPEDLEGEPHVTRIVEKMKPKISESKWQEVKEELLAQSLSRSPRDGRLGLSDNDGLIEYSTMPLPDGRVLVTQVDVTDTVRVEKALRERNAALEEAEQIKADFLSNVSYQLRTPLNAIMGFAEILAQEYFGKLSDKQKEYTDGIQEAGQRLIHLIDDILDLTSIEAGTMELQIKEVSLHDIIRSLFELVHDWARKENIDFKLDLADENIQIKADQRRIKQILINLIRNAITHTPDGGCITLKTEIENGHALIHVTDTGSGISEDDQKRIFQPFERAKDGLRMGAGLGLSLVKNIIKLHQGSIDVSSTEGKGTTITFRIPVHTATTESDDKKSKTGSKKTAKKTTKKKSEKKPHTKSGKKASKKPDLKVVKN